MKKTILLAVLSVLASACTQSSMNPDMAGSIDGLYQLTEYDDPNLSDINPTGAVSATRLDNEHLRITVKGTTGKTKITYAYASVLVTSIDRNTYELTVKGKTIGQAGEDAISRYVTLTPTASITLNAVEF